MFLSVGTKNHRMTSLSHRLTYCTKSHSNNKSRIKMKDTCVYVLYYHMCTRFETKVRLYPNALIADKNVGKNRP